MKESRFIAQNKEKWQESEDLLKNSTRDPEKLSSLFTQVIDDLSYSRTYYPNRSVRVYLNKIAREYFFIIYRHHKNRKNAFKDFWFDELPQIVYRSRKLILISLLIFVFSAGIGIFSSMNDPGFASAILGDDYVAMTRANIEKGDPMAVYKQGHQVSMFLGITFNNLMVAFRTFVLGIFFSLGTVAALLYNGIMVGCFQYFFVERGLFAESALAIWLHGTLEISSIILAGGAGLILGSGLLFPGTYSRLQAFQISGIRSLKLMLGVTPVFVLAALIESFLTRYTDVPDAVRLLLILLSASFIIGYFVVYPWVKSRRGFDHPLPEVTLPPDALEPLAIDRIKNSAEIVKDTFAFYKRSSGRFLSWIAWVTLAMAFAELLFTEGRTEPVFSQSGWASFFANVYYGVKTMTPAHLAINTLGSSLILYRITTVLDAEVKGVAERTLHFPSLLLTVGVCAALYGIMLGLGGWGGLVLAGTFLFFLMLAFAPFTESTNFFASVFRVIGISVRGCGTWLGLQFIVAIMSFCFLLVLAAPLFYINASILEWNFPPSDLWSRRIIDFLEIFARLFAFNLILPLFGASAAFQYFSLREMVQADHLKMAISAVDAKYLKGTKG